MIWLIVCCFIVYKLIMFFEKHLKPTPVSIANKHVVVTGGSSGIGKAVAILAAKQGANVTLLARNRLTLEEAKTEIQSHIQPNAQRVQCISVDLSTDYGTIRNAIHQAEATFGPVFMLVNSAGASVCRTFEDLDVEEFKKLMELNYYSALFSTKACITSMIQQNAGRILFLSSQAGQIGLFGYTAYSASKFALRGLAESLQMEMTPYNVRVTVAFPPDTDTPGYQQELLGKPKETILISKTAGLWTAKAVAHKILNDSLRGHFISYMGVDGWMLSTISAGMAPATSVLTVIEQFLTMGLLRVVGLFYLAGFDRIVLRCKRERELA